MNTMKWFLLLGMVSCSSASARPCRDPRLMSETLRRRGPQTTDRRQPRASSAPATSIWNTASVRWPPLHPGRVAAILAKENEHVEAGARSCGWRTRTPSFRWRRRNGRDDGGSSAGTGAQAARSSSEHGWRSSKPPSAPPASVSTPPAISSSHKEKQLKDKLASAAEDVHMTRAEVKALEQQNARRTKNWPS